MEKIIEYFATNPVHLAIALVLAFIILFSFVKKLLKLGLVIIAILIIYIAYLVYTGQEFDPGKFDEVGQKAKEIINESKESIEKTIDKKKKKQLIACLKELKALLALLLNEKKLFLISHS